MLLPVRMANMLIIAQFLAVVPQLQLHVTAQTLPPHSIAAALTPQYATRSAILATGNAVPRRPVWLLPLLNADEADIKTFYEMSNWLTAVQQVRFLYGFQQGSKSLSADLANMVFPNGVQVTLGSTVTSTGTKSAATTQADSAAQAIERLKTGGDFYVRAAYPLLAKQSTSGSNLFSVLSVSRMGFNVSGLGDEVTITEGTERNFNSSIEAYGQYGALDKKGFIYGVVRSGWQNVQPDFATSTGIPKNFGMTQIGGGIQFGEFMRVGFQRFYGPAGAFAASRDQLARWHLVLQIMPLNR